MTNEEARNMFVAKLICLTRETSGTDTECNSHNCENCGLNYDQGNMGEQKEALEMAIKALEQQPKIGHWINCDDKCPCCGKSKFEDLDADIWGDWQPDYCPNRGAYMKGEKE